MLQQSKMGQCDERGSDKPQSPSLESNAFDKTFSIFGLNRNRLFHPGGVWSPKSDKIERFYFCVSSPFGKQRERPFCFQKSEEKVKKCPDLLIFGAPNLGTPMAKSSNDSPRLKYSPETHLKKKYCSWVSQQMKAPTREALIDPPRPNANSA